jgi:hypothetical protein
MRRSLPLLLVPLLAAAAPRWRLADPEALLRAGDAAFEANEPARAAECYDQAGVRTTEPSRAAFNLATAKYRLALGKQPEALADAEVAYRSCLEKGDPYRARALLGLGNCLLLRAASGATLDRATLRAAIDRFGACLADPNCDPALARDARHNRARARLLLLQAPPPPGTSEDPGSEDNKEPDNQADPPGGKDDDGNEPGTGSQRTQSPGAPGSTGAEPAGETGDSKTGAGGGRMLTPPLDSQVPLPPGDAVEHIERATRRILDDLAAYRRGKARPVPPGVRDW